MNIPATLRAGDTIAWTESISDYPATGGWSLAFSLTAFGKTTVVITATTSGSDYAISVLPAVTKTWVAGKYDWQAYVYKGTPPTFTEKHTVEVGQVTILPDLTQATSSTDNRSTAKKNLDMIEACLSGNTSPDIVNYSIGGRSLSRWSRQELFKERDIWKSEYQKELDDLNTSQGKPSSNPIGIRFNRV